MAYTTINKSGDYFGTLLYTGNNTNDRDITGLNFTPDFTWIKGRSAASDNGLFDIVRGADKSIRSNATRAEDTSPSNKDLDSFISGGIRVDQSNYIDTNSNSMATVAWNWKANGAGSSNTDGAITSTVSVNTTAGFSIVKWTANGANGNVVGHGLGATPQIVIYKKLTGTNDWYARINGVIDGSQDYLVLNSTNAKANDSSDYPAPTNTLMTSYGYSNGSSMIAYAFAEKTGYSKIGSYTGNGNNDGSFVYTGFKPAFTIIKNTTTAGFDWVMDDVKRSPFNEMNNTLFANENYVEYTGGAYGIDYLSNGFKIRDDHENYNKSGDTYIYMAFGQSLVGTNNIPATAR